ncbi:MAG: ABC transporter substrate-binding protein [Chloroflexi bacterium]|nr:ABC transporter substrate-binding protein [Chloroflexota bacterium]
MDHETLAPSPHRWAMLAALVVVLVALAGCRSPAPSKTTIVVAHLYSVTQPQIFVGVGKGYFAQQLPGVTIERRAYPDGGQIMAAFRNGEVDIAYTGSVPALLSYIQKPNFKIVAGTNVGGTVLVIRSDRQIASLKDLDGKTIAVPGVANFQDIVLRAAILPPAGLQASAEAGPGRVRVVTSAPADMLTKLREGSVDAVITFEPWASRILLDPAVPSRVLVDWDAVWRQGNYPSSVMVASTEMLSKHGDVLKRFLAAHVDANQFVVTHRDEAIQVIYDQILEMQGAALPKETIASGLDRGRSTYDPSVAAVIEFARLTREVYPDRISAIPSADELFDLGPLNEVLGAKGLPLAKP